MFLELYCLISHSFVEAVLLTNLAGELLNSVKFPEVLWELLYEQGREFLRWVLEKLPMGMFGVAQADPDEVWEKLQGLLPTSTVCHKKTWESRVGVAKNVSLRAWIWLLSLFCAANEVIFKLVFCSSLKSCSPLLTVPLLFNKVEISVFFFCMKQWIWLSYSQSAPQLSSLIHISQSSSVWFPKTPCLPSYYLLS